MSRPLGSYSVALIEHLDDDGIAVRLFDQRTRRWAEVTAEYDCQECRGTGRSDRPRGDGEFYNCEYCLGHGGKCARCLRGISRLHPDRCVCPVRVAEQMPAHTEDCAVCDRADAAEDAALETKTGHATGIAQPGEVETITSPR